MTGKKPIGSDIRSDLKNTDALSITPEQYQEIPELTEQWFSEAEPHVGGRKVGRPKSANPKVPLKLRLDRDVVQAVDLGLPARPGGPERLHHVAVEAQFEWHLGVDRFGPANLAAADVRLRLLELLLGEFGNFRILLGRDRHRVSLVQIATNIAPNGPFPGHWPSSSK